jgi:hypothetical protein
MDRNNASLYHLAYFIILALPSVLSQSISTNTPVPPLQWYNALWLRLFAWSNTVAG